MTPLLLSIVMAGAQLDEAVLRVVQKQFEHAGRSLPEVDPALERACAVLAKKTFESSATEAAGLLSVTEQVSKAGGWDPNPLGVFVRAPQSALLDELRKQTMTEEPAERVGVSVYTEGSNAAACVLLSHRRSELKPFPRLLTKPGTQQLCAQLLGTLQKAEVYVTLPAGTVEQRGMDKNEDALCAPVSFTKPGRYVVEVLGRGARGPEVAALFFVDVGTAAAKKDLTFLEPSTPETARVEVLTRINALRTAYGAQQLKVDRALEKIAQTYADRMSREGFFAHIAPDGTDLSARLKVGKYRYQSAGENLGAASGPLAAHFGIEHSPGHRKTLLEPQHEAIGIGIAQRGKDALIVEVLAKPFVEDVGATDETIFSVLNKERARKQLPPLQRMGLLDQLAARHAKRAVELNMAKVDLPGKPLAEQVFEATEQVKSVATDLYVTDTAHATPSSRNLSDAANIYAGIGVNEVDDPSNGKRYWVVILYAR